MLENINEKITELAELYFTPKQIAIICEIPSEVFLKEIATEGSEYYNAFYKGYYAIEAKRRASLIKVAIGGSSEAQKQVNELRDKVIIDIS